MKYLRLKKQSDFQKLFSKGKRLFSATLTMVYMPSKAVTMGISIGKKHGKAHLRNRIKRLLREAFRNNVDMIKGNYSFILLPKISDEYSFEKYNKDIYYMLKKAQL